MAEIKIQRKKSKFVPIMLIIIIITLVIWLISSIFFKSKPHPNTLNSRSIQVTKLYT
jgi:flagellar basal body-associated protein FliL